MTDKTRPIYAFLDSGLTTLYFVYKIIGNDLSPQGSIQFQDSTFLLYLSGSGLLKLDP